MNAIARTLACAWLALAGILPIAAATAAEPARTVHGSADAFAAPGVALAWGVLRGATEGGTVVVIRVRADPTVYPSIAANGIDPFTSRSEPLMPRTATAPTLDIRVPRARFADLPRTEILLYGTDAATPGVVVFYVGVPDTTPEFAASAVLDASLDDRIARVRSTSGSKTP